MNQQQIIGHLGQDPEMRYLPDGQAVTNFSVAVSRRFTTKAGDAREETDWFGISAWGKLGELCNEHLAKGRQVFVQGRIGVRDYQDRNGEKQYQLTINAEQVRFLGGGGRPVGDVGDIGDEAEATTAFAAAVDAGHSPEQVGMEGTPAAERAAH